jgi:hypothetical protein
VRRLSHVTSRTQCISLAMSVSALDKSCKITQNLCSNLVIIAKLYAGSRRLTDMLFETSTVVVLVEREWGGGGEISRCALPVLTKGILFFVSFVSSGEQIIQYLLH